MIVLTLLTCVGSLLFTNAVPTKPTLPGNDSCMKEINGDIEEIPLGEQRVMTDCSLCLCKQPGVEPECFPVDCPEDLGLTDTCPEGETLENSKGECCRSCKKTKK